MAAPRKYPDELREWAIRMAVDPRGDPATRKGALARVGEQLGFNSETLRGWVQQAEIDVGDQCAKASPCVETVREERTGKTVKVRHNYTDRAVWFFSNPKNTCADVNVDRTYKG
ncbi:transposase [Isoptericola sp. S6320L]|uniref:transposase n=1 Tax=Isoptericola sp. S6320L TaxID=2926411 RepID=UPI001FF3ABF5|nr:transposase [Isoptericola sp. S6320L]MCK0115839.1 transposase [Isoptericola sp. S6320L]